MGEGGDDKDGRGSTRVQGTCFPKTICSACKSYIERGVSENAEYLVIMRGARFVGCHFGHIVFRLVSRITTERGCTVLWEARSWLGIMHLVRRSETRGLFGEAVSDDADILLERGSASAKLQRGIFFLNGGTSSRQCLRSVIQ